MLLVSYNEGSICTASESASGSSGGAVGEREAVSINKPIRAKVVKLNIIDKSRSRRWLQCVRMVTNVVSVSSPHCARLRDCKVGPTAASSVVMAWSVMRFRPTKDRCSRDDTWAEEDEEDDENDEEGEVRGLTSRDKCSSVRWLQKSKVREESKSRRRACKEEDDSR